MEHLVQSLISQFHAASWTSISIEFIGWLSLVLLVASRFMKKRALLHAVGFAACIFKLIYTYHYGVWPLFYTWVAMIGIDLYQWFQYGKIEGHGAVEAK